MASKSLVCSLYRKSLKTALSWADGRVMWRITALNLRDVFEANRHVTEPRQLRALLQQTEEELEKWKHPDPYIPPTAPGVQNTRGTYRLLFSNLLRVPRHTSRINMEVGE